MLHLLPVTDAPLHALLYQSMAVQPWSAASLNKIAAVAALHNERRGVTGLLLYGEMVRLPHLPGQFVQWLEGPEEAVTAAFEWVHSDRRHTDIRVLARGPMLAVARSTVRLFPTWSMAVRRLASLPATREGFLEYVSALSRPTAA